MRESRNRRTSQITPRTPNIPTAMPSIIRRLERVSAGARVRGVVVWSPGSLSVSAASQNKRGDTRAHTAMATAIFHIGQRFGRFATVIPPGLRPPPRVEVQEQPKGRQVQRNLRGRSVNKVSGQRPSARTGWPGHGHGYFRSPGDAFVTQPAPGGGQIRSLSSGRRASADCTDGGAIALRPWRATWPTGQDTLGGAISPKNTKGQCPPKGKNALGEAVSQTERRVATP